MAIPPPLAPPQGQFSIIGQPPSLLRRLAPADSTATSDTHWAPSPSPPPSAPPETPKRPLGRPSLLEALTGSPSNQHNPVASSSGAVTAATATKLASPAPTSTQPVSNLFDFFAETVSKTFKASEKQPAAPQPPAPTAPTSFYFRADSDAMPGSSNIAGSASSLQIPGRHATPSAHSNASTSLQSDAMQVDAPPSVPSGPSLSSSRIQAEIKRHHTEHVELLTIRQTYQRVLDLHEELRVRHEDTMHAFEREKEQMQKLVTVSTELFERADQLITRQEDRWRDEEQELLERERQEQEARRLVAEAEAREREQKEQRIREEQEKERQRQEEEQRRRDEEEQEKRRQEEEEQRRREEVERERAELARRQQQEAQRLADERAREEAMEKERQAAEEARKREEQAAAERKLQLEEEARRQRLEEEARKRKLLEEAAQRAREEQSKRREELAAAEAKRAQKARAAPLTPSKASSRANGDPNLGTKVKAEANPAAAAAQGGLHLGEPGWTVGPSNSMSYSQLSSPESRGALPTAPVPKASQGSPRSDDAASTTSMKLQYPPDVATPEHPQAIADRERTLSETLRKKKATNSSPSSPAASTPSTPSVRPAAPQNTNGTKAKGSRPPSATSSTTSAQQQPASGSTSQRPISRQGTAATTITASRTNTPTTQKATNNRKQKAPSLVLVKPEPATSPVVSPIDNRPLPIPSANVPAVAPATRPQESRSPRIPALTGLPPKPTVAPPAPRNKAPPSKSPDQARFSANGDRSGPSSAASNRTGNSKSTGTPAGQPAVNPPAQSPGTSRPLVDRVGQPQAYFHMDDEDGWNTTERSPVAAPRSPTPEHLRHPPPPIYGHRSPSPVYRRASRDLPPHRRSPPPPSSVSYSPPRKRMREEDLEPSRVQRMRYDPEPLPPPSPPDRRPRINRARYMQPSLDSIYQHGRSRSRSPPPPVRQRGFTPPPPYDRHYSPEPIGYRAPVRREPVTMSGSVDRPRDEPRAGPSNPDSYRPPPPPLAQRITKPRQAPPPSPPPMSEPGSSRLGLLSRMTDGAPSPATGRGPPNKPPQGNSSNGNRRQRQRPPQPPKNSQPAPKRGPRGGGGGSNGSIPLADRMSDRMPDKRDLESRLA